ncbi:MAG: hypothetical protein VW405_20650 [Rhodospirillaceae bacterium]|jgi:hypothetical protein
MKGWRGPEYEGEFPSLGWQVVDFLEAGVKVPAGPLYGQQIELTEDQVQFFVRLYALSPEGRGVYRRACRMGPKGKGKSPEGAMFCLAEFAGPVQFDGWDARGEPVGKPRDYPWVQVAACSEEQDHNLYGPLREMVAESQYLDDLGIDLGKTRIEFKNRPGKLEPVSASAGAREGQPITAAALEETGLWLPSKGGPKLARVLRRNAGKTNGRSVEFTNPPALGEGSVAESTLVAAEKGERGLLFDWAQGSFVDDHKNPENREAVLASLRSAYDDGTGKPVEWIDLDRQYAELLDADTTLADGCRFYFSLARKAENRAFDPKQFDLLADPTRIPEGPVVLMFDGARTRDCAVLTAWDVGDDDRPPHHFHVASWERPTNADAGYEHPRGEIRSAVRDFMAEHLCVMFAYDSSFHELNSLYDEWVDEYGELEPGKGVGLMVAYPTASGQRMEKALKRIQEDCRQGLFSHDGSDVVTRHVHNAVAAKNRGGWLILDKETDSLKIDAAVTMTFGYDLLAEAREEAALRQPGDVWFAFT